MNNTKKLVSYGVLMALTVVMTMVIHIPSPAQTGYINLGDMVIFIAAFFFGKKAGFLVGGVGSALADLLFGYSVFAPVTLIVKGIEGYVAGVIFETDMGRKHPIIPSSIGGLIMAGGYFIAEIFMFGFNPSLINLPANIVQGLFGAISASILYKLLKGKINI
jgi:uncharacterized membrane protein